MTEIRPIFLWIKSAWSSSFLIKKKDCEAISGWVKNGFKHRQSYIVLLLKQQASYSFDLVIDQADRELFCPISYMVCRDVYWERSMSQDDNFLTSFKASDA